MKERKGMRSRELLPPITRRLGPDGLLPGEMLAGKRIDAGPSTRAGRKAQRIRDPLICFFSTVNVTERLLQACPRPIPLLKSLAVDLVASPETLA